jgi:hypothetical protein
MKVICVDNTPGKFEGFKPEITIGKMYGVIEKLNIPFSPYRIDDPSGPFYRIECDNGKLKHIEANRFRELNLDEKRELKLDDLGI